MEILVPKTSAEPDVAAKAAAQIRQLVQGTWSRMRYAQSEAFRLVWNHPTLTPQQVCDALGAEASELFTVGSDLSSLILTYDPEFSPEHWQPPVTPVFNEDGTVTIPEPE